MIVYHILRRFVLQRYFLSWLFMYTHFLSCNVDAANNLTEEQQLSYYHMIDYDKSFYKWWAWKMRAIAYDKDFYDTVISFYKTHNPSITTKA